MNHTQRIERSDAIAQPEFFYTYVLKLTNGTFYIGSTANPAARFTEHAIDVGAEATRGHQFDVVMVQQFGSRREAEYNESRIKDAHARSPQNVEAMADNFRRINQMIAPQKTLAELENEARVYEMVMKRLVHKWLWRGMMRSAECGWKAPSYDLSGRLPTPGTAQFVMYHHPGPDDWDKLASFENACLDCLAKRPTD